MILNLILVVSLLITIGLAASFFFYGNRIVKKYLSTIFLLISFEIFYFYAELHDNNLFENIAYFLSEGFGPLLGPFLWLYICAVVNRPVKRFHTFYYFIYPILNLLVVVLPITVCLFLKQWISEMYRFFAYNYDLVSFPNFILDMVYLSFSLRVLFKHQKLIKNHFSQTNAKSLDWLIKFCTGAIVIMMIDFSTTIYEQVVQEVPWNIGLITIVSLCFFLVYLGYHGFKQQQIIMPSFVYEMEDKTSSIPVYSKERVYLRKFQDSEIVQNKECLLSLMTDSKLFLKADLTLIDLAEELGMTDKQTTELLNLELNTNFYDFVNGYRVEEVKSRIAAKNFENLTLLALGIDSGFQSKSSFNRVFKKNTGLSPSEYKKSLIK